MNLRHFQMLGLVSVAMLQSDCVEDCPPDPCPRNFDILGWCATSKTCRLNGQPVIDCECCGKTPDCPLWRVAPGSRIELPFDQIWPSLGKRNDLYITWGRTFGDEQNVELFFDGVPEAPGMCDREPNPSRPSVSCPNLPSTLQRLEFRYKAPQASGGTALVYLDMFDNECEATVEPCPR